MKREKLGSSASKPLSNTEKGEICAMYREARDKTKQIKILSELYLISRSEVCYILKDLGIDDAAINKVLHGSRAIKSSSRVRVWTAEEEEEARRLFNSGKDITRIAKKLGRSYDSVRCKLSRYG